MKTTTLIAWLRAGFALILVGFNTVLHVLPLLLVALIKLLTPKGRVRRLLNHALAVIAESWIAVNSWMLDHLTSTQFEVEGIPEALAGTRFLVIANHQSWVDIPVLQKVFNRRLPLLRFFLKRELIWVPLLGLAWWALDFPFMRRHSRAEIEKRPELAGRDLEATRRACEKFSELPVAIMNFVEGTRFTEQKRQAQGSPYRHLLRPRSGGIAFVIESLPGGIDRVIDVTIAYPGFRGRGPSLFELCANRVPRVRVVVREVQLPHFGAALDYQHNAEHKTRFQAWLNALWSDKDRLLDRLLQDEHDWQAGHSGSPT
ncbi:MAG: acyltransferase [Wenzhouxiangellaceae bacterium]